jgi:hypothetical protein
MVWFLAWSGFWGFQTGPREERLLIMSLHKTFDVPEYIVIQEVSIKVNYVTRGYAF